MKSSPNVSIAIIVTLFLIIEEHAMYEVYARRKFHDTKSAVKFCDRGIDILHVDILGIETRC